MKESRTVLFSCLSFLLQEERTMTTKKQVLAIDIGNTNTHFGIIDTEEFKTIALRIVPTGSFKEELVSVVLDLFERTDKSFCSQIVIASGIGTLAEIARSKLEELFPGNVNVAKYTPDLPFKCKYKRPQHLGIDRLASVLYGHVVYTNRDLILISAGTAITIDLFQNNVFSGGTIFPGITTQLVSLEKATDALPLVSSSQLNGEIGFPGLTTEECIESGVLFGAAGAIERIVRELQMVCPDCTVLATGGDWDILKNHVSFPHESVPEMVLIGTALFERYL